MIIKNLILNEQEKKCFGYWKDQLVNDPTLKKKTVN